MYNRHRNYRKTDPDIVFVAGSGALWRSAGKYLYIFYHHTHDGIPNDENIRCHTHLLLRPICHHFCAGRNRGHTFLMSKLKTNRFLQFLPLLQDFSTGYSNQHRTCLPVSCLSALKTLQVAFSVTSSVVVDGELSVILVNEHFPYKS